MVFSFLVVFRNFNNQFSGSKRPYRTVKGVVASCNYNYIIPSRTYSKIQFKQFKVAVQSTKFSALANLAFVHITNKKMYNLYFDR